MQLTHFSDENIVIPFNLEVSIDEIRQRSFYTYKITELKEGMIVLANYNIEDTKTRGAWCVVLIGFNKIY